MSRRDLDGYRYIRQYYVQNNTVVRWSLWERRSGRMRRVGTAWSQQQSDDFLLRRDV